MYVDVAGTSQHNIAEEIEELARKKLGPNTTLSFQVQQLMAHCLALLFYCVCRILGSSVLCVYRGKGTPCDYDRMSQDCCVFVYFPGMSHAHLYCAKSFMMATGAAGYREVSEWRTVPTYYSHASHAMIYAEWPGRFLGKYDYKYAVAVRAIQSHHVSHHVLYIHLWTCTQMQLRFDGTMGFPGGLVDVGETPEQAASREIREVCIRS